jgi:membrane protein DedA with SNARE-associated domain
MTEFIQSLTQINPILVYVSVFGLMLINGAFNAPSSQLLYIFVGFLTTLGSVSLLPLILVGACGNTIGNIVVYEVIKKTGSKYLARFVTITPSRSQAFRELSAHSGFWYILLGKLVPGVKVTVPLLAGFSELSRTLVYTAFGLSSVLWAYLFITIGLFFGVHSEFTKYYGVGAMALILALGVYAYKKYPQLFASTEVSETNSVEVTHK